MTTTPIPQPPNVRRRQNRLVDDDGFEALTPAVRVYAVPHTDTPAPDSDGEGPRVWKPVQRPRRREEHSVVFDTETTNDRHQRLLFGVFRHYLDRAGDPPGTTCVAEGIFFADDLPTRDPDAYMRLVDHADTHSRSAAVPWGATGLLVIPQAQFVEDYLYRIGVCLRGTIVGFNLPFDLTRLALDVGKARGRNNGGFSLKLFEHNAAENRYRPRIAIRTIDAHRSLISFTRPLDAPQADHGRFVDCRTAAYAYTDQGGLSLEAACTALSVPYTKNQPQLGVVSDELVEYCRADVAATANLYRALCVEHARHPCREKRALPYVYSAASLGRAYLDTMGIEPTKHRHPRFPDDVCGLGMEAFYGGRAEAHIVKTDVPVAYCDFRSNYMTCNALIGTWRILTAEHLHLTNTTQQARELLADPDLLARCFDKTDVWPQLHTLVQVDPNDAHFPVRARYRHHRGRDDYAIGINPFRSERRFWYPLGDVIAAQLLGDGPSPIVHQAWQLTPQGTNPNLQPIKLCGELDFNPRTDDLFRALPELRQHSRTDTTRPEAERVRLDKFLKVLANAVGFGIHAQYDRAPRTKDPTTVTVYGGEGTGHTTKVNRAEIPGPYCFPPVAAAITGSARLLLALLQRTVEDAGGTYAFCDTDSMAIVATRTGTPPRHHPKEIPVLSWHQVDQIIERFDALNPYDPALVPGSILDLETENYHRNRRRELRCYAISAKRYQLTTTKGSPVKSTEHGLGYLRNPTTGTPTDFAKAAWHYIRNPQTEADWLDLPATSQLTVTSPEAHHWFTHLNHNRTYPDTIKPANFLLVAYPDPLDPHAAAGAHPVAAFNPNADQWHTLDWIDRQTGQPITLTTTPLDGTRRPDTIRVLTYRDLLDRYRNHTEATALNPQGTTVAPDTTGILRPRPIRCLGPVDLIGKEGNDLHNRATGLGNNDHQTLYDNPGDFFADLVVPVLRRLAAGEVAQASGVHLRTVQRALAGRAAPGPGTTTRLTALAIDLARDIAGQATSTDINALLRTAHQ